ncbi:LysR family transcriptional regulator [Aliidongia dinghuensis]|uniref:LysR family transcriptional regulator n=1 Tax=Aliidongia dinghuensis TaxID=1867774 RepID=A0A8J2Z0G4_9PROT|nr:LysR family transcriptional regulator [Aliidongia dinghuensis]GGF50429.1 LysR family transcriptional regulator [Aliidongia dinghuensis]
MDILDLRYLAVTASAMSLTRAAEMLGLNASTISRRITRVEDELGVTLFERGRSGLRLTEAGRMMMIHVQRSLDDIEALIRAGRNNGHGLTGKVRLGVRLPPIGELLRSLLGAWRLAASDVELVVCEMNDHELQAAIAERRLDVAFVPRHALWPRAASMPAYREALVAALPSLHPLSASPAVTWDLLRGEVVLTQEWEGSHTALEFFASFLGSGIRFSAHPASKQTVLGLVAAGYGVTLATASQGTVGVPGVTYVPIAEQNAWVMVDLVWAADREEPVVGRFVAFIRDEARSRGLG